VATRADVNVLASGRAAYRLGAAWALVSQRGRESWVEDLDFIVHQAHEHYGQFPFDRITEPLDVILASAGVLRDRVAAQHRHEVEGLMDALTATWQLYRNRWLDDEHRRQLAELAQVDWEFHRPEDVKRLRMQILASAPWAAAGRRAWRSVARVVFRLPNEDRLLFSLGSLLAGAIEGTRMREIDKPLVVGLRTPPITPGRFVSHDGFLSEWVSPTLAQLLGALGDLFPQVAGVVVDLSRHVYDRGGAPDYAQWAVGRLSTLHHGLERLLDGQEPQLGDLIEEWPPDGGWHFRPGEVWFKGQMIRLDGKRFALLKAFAEARVPLGYRELRQRVWHWNESVEDRTIRSTLARLRNALRERFGWDEAVDPIPDYSSDPVTWRLDRELFDRIPPAVPREPSTTASRAAKAQPSSRRPR
jgi:hypothetical protein